MFTGKYVHKSLIITEGGLKINCTTSHNISSDTREEKI